MSVFIMRFEKKNNEQMNIIIKTKLWQNDTHTNFKQLDQLLRELLPTHNHSNNKHERIIIIRNKELHIQHATSHRNACTIKID